MIMKEGMKNGNTLNMQNIIDDETYKNWYDDETDKKNWDDNETDKKNWYLFLWLYKLFLEKLINIIEVFKS